MRVLVACEFSGIVRDAFISRGHDAVSCDLLPTERPGPHIQGDVTPLLREPWDLVIAHPPCTYLSYAGMRHWNNPGRAESREEALRFFMACYEANAPRVCVENPFGWPCQAFRKPDQIINPFDFGEPIRKRTCLWLRGLPILFRGDDLFAVGSTQPVAPPEPVRVWQDVRGHRVNKDYGWYDANNGKHRSKHRSKSWPSIALAMAEQWG